MSDVVLFDALETLGSEIAASTEERFTRFEAHPSARRLLEDLRGRARVGVVSLDPEIPLGRLREVMASEGLRPLVDPDLVFAAFPRGETPFTTLLDRSGLAAQDTVFVSLDASARIRAMASGLRVAPHPSLVPAVLDREPLHLVRLEASGEADWLARLEELDAAPLLPTHEPDPVLYAIASERALGALRGRPAPEAPAVEVLGGAEVVAGTTLVLLQMPREAVQADPEVRDFLEHLERTLPLVRPTPHGWIVAFPGDRSPEELHPPPAAAGHGHSRALLPSPGVLRPPRRRGRLERRELDDREHQLLGTLDGASAERELEGLGGSPGGGGEPQP